MPKEDLLPGVTEVECPPAVVCASAAIVKRARRRAAVRDALQIALLIAVDYLFFHWSAARLPLLGREDSILALAALNSGVLTALLVTRTFPRWSARRIASTWRDDERRRLEAILGRR